MRALREFLGLRILSSSSAFPSSAGRASALQQLRQAEVDVMAETPGNPMVHTTKKGKTMTSTRPDVARLSQQHEEGEEQE
jgi:hypothetical protein